MKKILVCEDQADICIMIEKFLSKENYRVEICKSGEECLSLYDKEIFAVLLDVHLPQMNGIEVLKKLKEKNPLVKVIVMTAHSSIEQSVKAIRLGAENYLAKPFANSALLASLKEMEKEEQCQNKEDELLWQTKSPRMEKFYQDLDKVASSEANVFIWGETGTGKEGIAKYIHNHSLRSKEAFIAVDCPSIPHSLFESEIFGHKAGAFTGANKEKIGRFERADGGTLFLDELGDIAPDSQSKLLRTIQTGDFEKLGDQKISHADVRVVSASSIYLESSETFRKDLYYRIAEFTLKVPALRERKEDIPILSLFLMKHLCMKNKRESIHLSDEVVEQLVSYSWPGNLRELRSLLHRLIILTPLSESAIRSIPKEYLSKIPFETVEDKTKSEESSKAYDLKSHQESVIIEALKKTDYNISQASKILNIGRTTLYRKLKSMKIDVYKKGSG